MLASSCEYIHSMRDIFASKNSERIQKTETVKNRESMENQSSELMELKKKLGSKIEGMAKDIGALAKDGTNTFSNYSYISNEQLITSIREKALEHQLSIISEVLKYEERESVNDKGKQVIRSIVSMEFELTDLETGYSESRSFVGAEQDTGGKSMQQAITQCSKYFYLKLFKVTSRDEQDPDANTNETQGASTPQRRASQQQDDDRVWLNPSDDERWQKIVQWIAAGNEFKGVYSKYKISKKNAAQLKKDAAELAEKLKG
jgi:hypothetical protein